MAENDKDKKDIRTALIRKNTGQDDKSTDLATSFRRSLSRAGSGGGLAVPDRRTSLPAVYDGKGGGAIGFIIDATGSRSGTWEQAQSIQADMFGNFGGKRGLRLRLTHYGGEKLSDHGWQDNAAAVGAAMRGVQCIGGSTQIVPALRLFAAGEQKPRADSIILIGDCFEEGADDAYALARELAGKNVKIYAFLEGTDRAASAVFPELAKITGGAFAAFGPDMKLGDLCNAVAAQSTGGAVALGRLAASGSKAAKLIADQQNRLKLGPGRTP